MLCLTEYHTDWKYYHGCKISKAAWENFLLGVISGVPPPHTMKKAKNIKPKKNSIYQNGKATRNYKNFQRSNMQIWLLSLANSIHLLCGTKFSLRLSQLSSILQSQTVFVPQTIAHYWYFSRWTWLNEVMSMIFLWLFYGKHKMIYGILWLSFWQEVI